MLLQLSFHIYLCISVSPSLHFQSVGVFRSKMSLLYQHNIDGSCFIHYDSLCVFIRTYNSFTFRIIIDRYVFSAILLLVSGDFLVSFISLSLVVSPLHSKCPFNISCRSGLVDTNFLVFDCMRNSLSLLLF